MTTLEAFVCESIANTPRLTRTSCAGRHRAVNKAAPRFGGGVYQPECEDCAIGKAHARGETPTHWPSGRPLHLVQLTAAAPPREEPPEPTPALPPSLGVREAPRGAETATEDQGEEHVHEDSKRWVGATAPSEERSEPGADPQTGPETPAAPRRTRRKTYAFRGKDLTINEWMREPEVAALGISTEALRLRIKKGWPIEEALTTPKKSMRAPGPEPTRYPFRGQQLTVAEVAKLPEVQALGLAECTLYRRLRGRWTMEEAATAPKGTTLASLRGETRGDEERPLVRRKPRTSAAELGADLARTLRDAEERYGRCEQEREGDRAAIGRASSSRAETLMDLQLEVRAQLRALSAGGTPHGLADVYAAVRMELAAYDAITGGA